MSKIEIAQSENRFKVVGDVLELNLAVEEKEVSLFKNGEAEKVTCKTIVKKDFKNPSMLVEVTVDDTTTKVGVDFFPTHSKKYDENGKLVDNKRFDSMVDFIESVIPKSKDSDNYSRVNVSGTLGLNEYASKNASNGEYEFHSIAQLTAFTPKLNSGDDDACEGIISGIIRSITPEMKGEDETGRLIVEFYSFGYNGSAKPFTFIVDNDLADDFNDLYDNGDSCELSYTIQTRHVGGTKKKKSAFGRSASVNDGFDVTEFVIIGGDEAFDEDSEYFIDTKAMKTAMKEREIFIEERIQNRKEYDENNGGGKSSAKSKGLGKKASVETTDTVEDSELPF